MADKRISNRSIDAPLPIEPNYEERILERLKASPLTERIFKAFLSRVSSPVADSRRLAAFLYDVVYCRQVDKPDHLIKPLTGIESYNLKYAPKHIDNFCEWVKPYIDFQRASGNTQDFENILPELHHLAHLSAIGRKKSGRWRSSYSTVTAALFAYDRMYSEKSLREVVQYHKPKKGRTKEK